MIRPVAMPEPEFNTTPAPPFRRSLLRRLHTAMHYTGLSGAYRTLRRVHGATILMYHSVPGPSAAGFIDPANAMSTELFAAQMATLARRRRVISMTDLVDRIERNDPIPAGTVVLTFDDGYLDNLEVAAPILARHNLPALLYLATGYVTRAQPQWIDELYTAFGYRTRHDLSLDAGGAHTLNTEPAALAAYRAACGLLISATPDARHAALASIVDQLAPSRSPPKLTLDWSDARRLAEVHPGFELGVHTHEHLDLTAATLDAAERELRTSIDAVERETGRRPVHFSFPYGRHNDQLRRLAASVGLRSAVGAGDNVLITADADRYALPRIEAPQSLPLLSFYTSGAYPGLSRMLLGRS